MHLTTMTRKERKIQRLRDILFLRHSNMRLRQGLSASTPYDEASRKLWHRLNELG